jgi:D-aminoacyl-tRNA deacylase
MRVVVQRVSQSKVVVEGKVTAEIGNGLLILLGIEEADSTEDIDWLVKKITQLRIFNDDQGVMNLAITDVNGDAIVVSQFTLHASTKKGNRPSYIRAARPETAIPLYEKFISALESSMGKPVGRGIFGAHMEVSLTNDGPVTIILDTKNKDF